ncbi:MAG: DUF4268 domain-containing protein [Candidatus Poribacteria bacterium]|nr:DUF4268 domain-containing protein [Candidatus Poribacteria bacterium]
MTNTNMPKFSKLKKIKLRKHFPNEATDFTPWLAENIDRLSDALDLDLEVIDTNYPVGNLELDLLAKAKNENSSKTVIIENQLEKADHRHLGQLLAYAAGLDAKIIIWIADEFRDEYRQVLEWLNEQTPIEIGFFAVIVELLQIEGLEDSPVALEFRAVIAPNQWKKSVKPTGDTERQKRYRNFYQQLIDELRETGEFGNPETAQPYPWHYFWSRHSGVTYCVRFSRGTQATVYIRIYQGYNENRLALFDALEHDKAAIEEAFGSPFEWLRSPEKQESTIIFAREGNVNWENTDALNEIHKWCIDNLLKLKEVFDPKIEEAMQAHELE